MTNKTAATQACRKMCDINCMEVVWVCACQVPDLFDWRVQYVHSTVITVIAGSGAAAVTIPRRVPT